MANDVDDGGILGQLLAEDEAAGKPDGGGAPPPDVEALQRQLDYEKQRNDSLQGRIDSQLRPLNQTVRELQQRLASVQASPAPAPAPAPETEVTVQDLLEELTPEERDLMGEKQLKILSRLIEKPTQALVNKVRAELQASFTEQFGSRLQVMEGQMAGQTGRELWDRVDRVSPGVKALNDSDDPRWVEFLGQPDPVSGRLRRDLGNAAVDANDVTRLAMLHAEFLKSTGAAPAAPGEPAPGAARELRPEGSRAEPGVSSTTKPTVKRTEVDKFYKDLADGKYEGKPALAEKMETLITEAIQDGRVV